MPNQKDSIKYRHKLPERTRITDISIEYVDGMYNIFEQNIGSFENNYRLDTIPLVHHEDYNHRYQDHFITLNACIWITLFIISVILSVFICEYTDIDYVPGLILLPMFSFIGGLLGCTFMCFCIIANTHVSEHYSLNLKFKYKIPYEDYLMFQEYIEQCESCCV